MYFDNSFKTRFLAGLNQQTATVKRLMEEAENVGI